jgi:penicillin amidase
VPGWSGEYEWVGEVPFEEMPHALNPEQGYVVTCNHRIVPDDYPHYLGRVWMNGYRARRIVDVFESMQKLSVDEFRMLHLDVTCLPGKEFVARLEGLESTDPDVQLALEHLLAWDGRLTPESVAGALYEVVRYTLVRELLEPGLGPELTVRLMGHGFHPLLFLAQEFYGHDTVTLFRLLDNPDSWWVQQAGGREAVLTRSLRRAVAWLRGELGPDVQEWQWGKIHRVTFAHSLSLQKPFDQVFDRGPFPIGGDTDTPCQTAISPDDPYDNTSYAPSFRQIIDLGDLARSVAVNPPGQSGHLGSPHYDDLIEPWLKGDYYPLLWTREQVEQEAQSRLVLEGEG